LSQFKEKPVSWHSKLVTHNLQELQREHLPHGTPLYRKSAM